MAAPIADASAAAIDDLPPAPVAYSPSAAAAFSLAAAQDDALSRRILRLPEAERLTLIRALHATEARELIARWSFWAHHGQAAPDGPWRVWLIQAGRGFGKTRAGAEWIIDHARRDGKARIALVGASLQEVRRVMVEGPSGLLAVAPARERPSFSATRGELEFPSGATARIYAANAPETLRGGEHHIAWCDELAKWRYPAAWDNLVMGLRGGDDPRVLITTTPRKGPVLDRVLAAEGLVRTGGSTTGNPHLPRQYVSAMLTDYDGTRLGRQELHGELLGDVEGALWTQAMLTAARIGRPPDDLADRLVRVVVGVDPPASATGDACGIVACGLDADGSGYVLEDASIAGASPERWARAVAACAARWRADRVVAEKNNGGDMVASVLAAADARLPVRLVHATRGKAARAEPVAALYERGRVRHAGAFPALEAELAGFQTGGGYAGPGASPDRADACVWALIELMLGRRRAARVRGLR